MLLFSSNRAQTMWIINNIRTKLQLSSAYDNHDVKNTNKHSMSYKEMNMLRSKANINRLFVFPHVSNVKEVISFV